MKASVSTIALIFFANIWSIGVGQDIIDFSPMFGYCTTPLLEGRSGLQLAAWPDSDYDILAIGGLIGDSVVSSCEHYDAENDVWEAIAYLPEPRIEFTSHTFAGKVYVIGGWDGDSTVYNDILEFDPSVGEWNVAASLLGPRKGHASVHEGPMESGSVLVCGGHNGTAGLATCELINLANYEVLPGDTMVEPRERFQLFRIEQYSSQQFTMDFGDSWKFDPEPLESPDPLIFSNFQFPEPENYNGVLVVGGFNSSTNNPTSSCEFYMNGTWEQVQDLPLPLAEYSFGMGANPYVYEVNENSDAWFEFASPLAWSSAYVFGGETVNLETGEEAISSTFLSFQLESLGWQSYSLPASILAGKNQVLVHSPHISSVDSPLGGLGILAYLIGGEMVSADSMSQNIGYCLEFVESNEDYPFYTELTSTFAFGSWTCTPDLQLITPAFIQRGDRGYILGGNDNGTGIWIDLSPTYVVPYSVTEFSRNTLSVFPNPSSDQMTLRGESHSLKWKLFDSWGRIILSGQGQEIKVNNLSPGPYHLQTEDGRKAIVLVEK